MSGLSAWFWGQGRIGRQAYWIVIAVLVVAAWLTHTIAATLASAQPGMVAYAAVAMLLGQAASTWVSVCVATQRLHDIGRSGWWQLIPLGIMTAGVVAAEPAFGARLGLDEQGAALAYVVAIATYLSFLAVLGAVPSGGPNRFDAPVAADVF